MTDSNENLFLQIKDSEALKIRFFMRELYVNHYVVAKNFQELRKYLDAVESHEAVALIWGRDAMYLAMQEVTRLLLNFLASASARVEASRRMIRRRYDATPFFESYQSEVERRFKGNQLAEFVEGLRNYSLHYALPLASAHYEFGAGSSTQLGADRHYFALERDSLLSKSFEWAKGRTYLEGADDRIVIREFATEYFESIHEFQLWIERELRLLHKDELDWLEQAQAKERAIFEKMQQEADRLREEKQRQRESTREE